MRRLLHFATCALALAVTPATSCASAELVGCIGNNWGDLLSSLEPLQAGPLSLSMLRCLPIPQSYDRIKPPGLSGDGSKVFALDLNEGLWVGRVDKSTPSYRFATNVSSLLWMSGIPFVWLDDASAVLGVKEETAPRGRVSGTLSPFLFRADGTEKQLPPLSHPNGSLDEIYWIGTAGLGLAAFGTGGADSLPEHRDNRPTVALVDARAGKILQSDELARVPGLSGNEPTQAVASRVAKDGRVRVLVSLSHDKWMYWVQGEMPRIVPITLRTLRTPFALSPDGLNVLLMGNLSATGLICEFGNPCPDPTPVTGMVAELREISTGRLIWQIIGTAHEFHDSALPAVSPDGRYALISMPGLKSTIALIEMGTGKIVQQVGTLRHAGPVGLGFSPESNRAWVIAGTLLTTYNFADQ